LSVASLSERLADEQAQDGQFFARADNLSKYLEVVEKRLGSLAQRLAASVGQTRFNHELAGDPNARQSTPTPDQTQLRRRGRRSMTCFLKRVAIPGRCCMPEALEVDFAMFWQNKNAVVSLKQIIRELENTQAFIWSPMILNGTGFGAMANHSLVMASYISRANAAIIDLRNLQG
jgi:hypothetical protein